MNECLINLNLNNPPQQQHNNLLHVANSNNNHPIITSTTNMENVNQIFLNNMPSYTSIPSSQFDCNGFRNNGNLCFVPPSSNIVGQNNMIQCQQSYNIVPQQQQQQQILIIATNGLNDNGLNCNLLNPPIMVNNNNQNNVNPIPPPSGHKQLQQNWNTINNFNMNINNEYLLKNSQSHINVGTLNTLPILNAVADDMIENKSTPKPVKPQGQNIINMIKHTGFPSTSIQRYSLNSDVGCLHLDPEPCQNIPPAQSSPTVSLPPLDSDVLNANHDENQNENISANDNITRSSIQSHDVNSPASYDSHECTICNKTFKHKSNLTTHKRLHNENCPKCEFCGKKFARPSNLNQHRLSYFSIFSPYASPFLISYLTHSLFLNKFIIHNSPYSLLFYIR